MQDPFSDIQSIASHEVRTPNHMDIFEQGVVIRSYGTTFISWRQVCVFITLTEGEGISFGSVCLFVSVCLSLFVCLHRTFVFFSATACQIETKFSPQMWLTTHVECYNDNHDVIGHVVWQPCWKNGKTLDLYISETSPRKNWNLAHGKYSWGMSLIFKTS